MIVNRKEKGVSMREHDSAGLAPNVIVSNGFGRFHMRLAAAEAGQRDAPAAFLTGTYPTAGLSRFVRGIGANRFPAVARFLARERGWVCLEDNVGANVGQFPLLVRALHPDARIVAFEPLPDVAARY